MKSCNSSDVILETNENELNPLHLVEANKESSPETSATKSPSPVSALKNKKGFSLLEIMIVLGIIGTIIAMIGQRVLGARDRAKVKEAQMALSQWTEAISMYYNDCGKNPATLDNIIKPDAECNNWDPGTYARLKTNDPWGNPINYSLEGTDYVLRSLGKDGKQGGSGFDADIDAGSAQEQQ